MGIKDRGDLLVAAGAWNTAAPNAPRFQRGCALARTGVGVYTATLDQGVPANEGQVIVSPRGAAGNTNIQVVHTSDTVKGINAFVAAVATDLDWDVQVYHILAGGA